MWFSSDHTGGPTTPRSAVADGDLAVGRVVEAISHSKYWKQSAIFVVEDDSQNGVDHVDGHRAPIQVISPWARHGVVDSRFYSQITMVRTIQQILGAHPLNQRLAAATPMYGAFTSKPDFTPYDAVANRIPLTEAITTPPACGLDTPPAPAAPVAQVAPAQQDLAAQWAQWKSRQHLTGKGARADSVAPEPDEPVDLVQHARLPGALPGRRPGLRPGGRARRHDPVARLRLTHDVRRDRCRAMA
ncbi:alkaline phosphatase family protein [Nocardioides convexus]|uniref:alkaline phosphatase family protein n=1 Tax=Nocardioides convexus TaxID=2712224 RepID=UPI00241830C0|nr:alkaline phosphatase family protein [Nocardioides convexus]